MHSFFRADRLAAAAAAVAVSLALAACGAQPQTTAMATEQCGTVLFPSLQGGNHLIGEQEPPVPYSSTPPTSGWHTSGATEISVRPADAPLSEPEQVSVLEAGAVVVTYSETLAPAIRKQLEQMVRNDYEGRVAVTPYHRLTEDEVVFTAWGALQRCNGLDLDAFEAFVSVYADEDPTAAQRH